MFIKKYTKLLSLTFILASLAGCSNTPPKDLFKLKPESLQQRQMQSRKYDTVDEENLLAASAGLLQDMGYALDESETKLGLLVASKKAETDNTGSKAWAHANAFLGALSLDANYKDAYRGVEDVQKFRVSVVVRPDKQKTSSTVRVTFQRLVWDMQGNLMGLQTLNNLTMYRDFFISLSKAIFLEGQEV